MVKFIKSSAQISLTVLFGVVGLMAVSGCMQAVTSGTGVTKIVASDAYFVDVRVFQDFTRDASGTSNIVNELRKADNLARFHCSNFNKVAVAQGVDNSLFKTKKYLCVPDNKTTTTTQNNNASQAATEQRISHEQRCVELGFTKKTEAFGNCVLKLLEIEAVSTASSNQSPNVPQPYSNVRQQPTDAERLEGLQQILNALSGGMNSGGTQQGTNTDLTCVNNCLKQGSLLNYCKSFCSY